jgi:hypothetical protein
MSPGELQAFSCAARGWVRRSVFVFFSYALREALKMDRKFEEEVDADVDVDGVWDIVETTRWWSESE